ncbi:di-trans,poly-cis-decaprenylcistransferase [Methanosalsum natronophilum]|uniref:Tritrans,polycis-undecaprenyl-diphosphate synthase (geranylgeranyl-diphosphate specific) n=1 Tax=Methanosalsum natronophilum TaxID=768733 RepID=A0A3R7VUV5_9EURY|nr:MAG: di-trans,poly-cis-decaprenylcistransferase [Methanosalsum natronophilum]
MMKKIIKSIYGAYEKILFQEVSKGPLPEHVAIIMDGNRRFANRYNKDTYFGHSKGAQVTENIINWSWDIGISELTVYAFSMENFNRSNSEIFSLFELMAEKFDEMRTDYKVHDREVRVRIVGNKDLLPDFLQNSIYNLEECTMNYTKCTLNIALAYGGRQDLVQATKELGTKLIQGTLNLDNVDEEEVSSHLYPSHDLAVPNVDLVIRSGGNERISNFLPWQTNGNECAAHFCAPFWPEFRKIDYLRSIRVYQDRIIEVKKNNVLRTTQLLSMSRKKKHTNIQVKKHQLKDIDKVDYHQ